MDRLKKELFPRDHHHLPIFLSLLALVIAIPLVAGLASNYSSPETLQSGAAKKECVPLPKCYYDGTCKIPLNKSVNSMQWCPPVSGTPMPSQCQVRKVCTNGLPNGKVAGVCKHLIVCTTPPAPSTAPTTLPTSTIAPSVSPTPVECPDPTTKGIACHYENTTPTFCGDIVCGPTATPAQPTGSNNTITPTLIPRTGL